MTDAFQVNLIGEANLKIYLVLIFIQSSYHHKHQISKPYDPVFKILLSESASICYLRKLVFSILKQKVEKSALIYYLGYVYMILKENSRSLSKLIQ